MKPFISEHSTRSQSCRREATRDVVFLFQRAKWTVVLIPDGYTVLDEVVCKADDYGDPILNEDDEPVGLLTLEQLSKIEATDYVKCAIKTWQTDLVFLTRGEAEKYGESRSYNYQDGWRVYGVCAEGEMATVLKEHVE